MDKELLKQIGAGLLFMLAGLAIWLLAKIGSLEMSLGDIAMLTVIIIAGIYIIYSLIKYFTGASVSDIEKLKDIVDKLLSVLQGESNEDKTE